MKKLVTVIVILALCASFLPSCAWASTASRVRDAIRKKNAGGSQTEEPTAAPTVAPTASTDQAVIKEQYKRNMAFVEGLEQPLRDHGIIFDYPSFKRNDSEERDYLYSDFKCPIDIEYSAYFDGSVQHLRVGFPRNYKPADDFAAVAIAYFYAVPYEDALSVVSSLRYNAVLANAFSDYAVSHYVADGIDVEVMYYSYSDQAQSVLITSRADGE